MSNNQKKADITRESNYDLLRIVSAIAVIMIHVSATYKDAITSSSFFGVIYAEHIPSTLFYNTISRFAVANFVLLSGAFLLSDERNGDYKYFYRKSFVSIGIPLIVFSIFYLIFSEIEVLRSVLVYDESISLMIYPIKNLILGRPFYHMWYLFMLIGLYLLVPVLVNLKNQIGERAYAKAAIVAMIVCTLSGWTSSFKLFWSISYSICFLGYFMLGYLLRKRSCERKNNGVGILLILLGFATEILLTAIQYRHTMRGLSESDEPYSLVESFNPLVAIAAILIFVGFSKLHFKANLKQLSALTFYIYLFHAGVWRLMTYLVYRIRFQIPSTIVIPASIVIVFLISWILAIGYSKLWSCINRKFRIQERICKKEPTKE